MTSNTAPTMSLRSILEKDKLNGTNFLDWYRNLRIVLRQERKEYIPEQPIQRNQPPMLLEHKRMLTLSMSMIQLMSLVSCLDAWSLSLKSN